MKIPIKTHTPVRRPMSLHRIRLDDGSTVKGAADVSTVATIRYLCNPDEEQIFSRVKEYTPKQSKLKQLKLRYVRLFNKKLKPSEWRKILGGIRDE